MLNLDGNNTCESLRMMQLHIKGIVNDQFFVAKKRPKFKFPNQK